VSRLKTSVWYGSLVAAALAGVVFLSLPGRHAIGEPSQVLAYAAILKYVNAGQNSRIVVKVNLHLDAREALARELRNEWPTNEITVVDAMGAKASGEGYHYILGLPRRNLRGYTVEYKAEKSGQTLGSATFSLKRNGDSWEVLSMGRVSIY
jgi:hypothetical protein